MTMFDLNDLGEIRKALPECSSPEFVIQSVKERTALIAIEASLRSGVDLFKGPYADHARMALKQLDEIRKER
jgi:hypothetical protein